MLFLDLNRFWPEMVWHELIIYFSWGQPSIYWTNKYVCINPVNLSNSSINILRFQTQETFWGLLKVKHLNHQQQIWWIKYHWSCFYITLSSFSDLDVICYVICFVYLPEISNNLTKSNIFLSNIQLFLAKCQTNRTMK